MENNNFKIRIIDFYKDIDKPIIDKMVNDNSFKNILELSTVSEIPLLKKDKNNWHLKDKRKILKDIENSKKKKIKEIKNNLSKIDVIKINDIKENNNKLLTDLESINLLKNNIENDDIYNNIKNLSLLSNNIELTKNSKKNQKGGKKALPFQTDLKGSGTFDSDFNSSIKIVNIEDKNINTNQTLETVKVNLDNLQKILLYSDSDDFIEIFSN
jgi:hypothetical protein